MSVAAGVCGLAVRSVNVVSLAWSSGWRAAAFVESRRQLFMLRQHVLPTFAAAWLLKQHDQEARCMAVGFHGGEEGAARPCREHPLVKQFAATHAASDCSAVDLTGLLCRSIEGMGAAPGRPKQALKSLVSSD